MHLPFYDLFSCVIIDLDFPEKRWFSPDREQRGVCSAASVCVLALRHQLMNLMNMNLTQGLDDAYFSSLNSHTYSQKKVICTAGPHPSSPDGIIQNENAQVIWAKWVQSKLEL